MMSCIKLEIERSYYTFCGHISSTLKGNETGANVKNESKETLETNMTNNSALKFCNPGIPSSHKAVSMYCKAFYSNSYLANELKDRNQGAP